MAELQAQWEVAKRPFEAQLEAQHAATRRQRERAEEQLRQIQEWRVETRELAAGARAREQEQQRLLAEYEAAPKNVNRATFVRRITEAGSRLTPAGLCLSAQLICGPTAVMTDHQKHKKTGSGDLQNHCGHTPGAHVAASGNTFSHVDCCRMWVNRCNVRSTALKRHCPVPLSLQTRLSSGMQGIAKCLLMPTRSAMRENTFITGVLRLKIGCTPHRCFLLSIAALPISQKPSRKLVTYPSPSFIHFLRSLRNTSLHHHLFMRTT